MVVGDFNNVLTIEEWQGGNVPSTQEIQPFAYCLGAYGLVDMRSRGRSFTWTNNTIRSMIDRVLVNEQWVEEFPEVEAWFQSESLSDHTRSHINLDTQPRKRKFCFKFCNMWGADERFLHIVKDVWQRQVPGDIMAQVVHKLKKLQYALSPLRKKYSDVMQRG